MLKALVLFLIYTVAYCEVTKLYKPCGKSKSFGTVKLNEVRVSPCPQAEKRKPCVLKRGHNVTIELDFTPNIKKTVREFKAKAAWATKLADIPLPNMNSNGCAFTDCPLENGKPASYKFNLLIAKSYPTRKYDAKWRFNGNGFNLCMIFPIVIQ
ncbi:ecdysteroid-regulated 16 kDa protein-like [Artemia franciscana]|uniref:MD-2-related lipid-recognition domain-containing protein n=1 Tax=Artemia franciscana TaxID=6661 RepID=A0AA88H916_ARTSF|nr:hypothetical protein QYM36_015370 [Artemia franciscana]